MLSRLFKVEEGDYGRGPFPTVRCAICECCASDGRIRTPREVDDASRI